MSFCLCLQGITCKLHAQLSGLTYPPDLAPARLMCTWMCQ